MISSGRLVRGIIMGGLTFFDVRRKYPNGQDCCKPSIDVMIIDPESDSPGFNYFVHQDDE